MIHTATISAQNTSVKVANIGVRNNANNWFANIMATGTFGTGTVSFQISPDGGVTKFTLNQDGTTTAASLTAAGCINVATGYIRNNEQLELYATIGTATNPSIAITVVDNQ
jgi:hypothetical protein